jgi:hypothetical protein
LRKAGNNMKNVYIGKTSITGKGIAICMVIDSDIATGNAIIYNRETDQIETITLAEKHTLYKNIRKLAEDTESEYEERVKRALEQYAEVNPLTSL